MKGKKTKKVIKNCFLSLRRFFFRERFLIIVFFFFIPLVLSLPKTPIFATGSCSNREDCPADHYPYCIENVNFNDCGGPLRCWEGDVLESLIGDCTYTYDPNAPTPTPPPFTQTNNNCNDRGGHCPKDLYPECTENLEYQNCSGPNFCAIPYYVPMGTVNPYNLVACASKTSTPPPSEPIGSPSNCPVCPEGFVWISGYQSCQKSTPSGVEYKDPQIVDCSSSTNKCYPGYGCNPAGGISNYEICDATGGDFAACKGCINGGGAWTTLGCIPTEPMDLVKWLFPYLLGFGGLAAFGLIVYSGFRLMTSSGDPQKIQGAKETITSAITGLIFIILSLFLLRLIGVDILGLPGLE